MCYLSGLTEKNLIKGHSSLPIENTNVYNKLNDLFSCYCCHYMVCGYFVLSDIKNCPGMLMNSHKSGFKKL